MKVVNSRREFLKDTGTVSIGILLGNVIHLGFSKPPKRPNVIWITAKDLSPDLGCYGNKLVRTPNIDRLAIEGAMFANAFTTSPVGSPSHSAFITGMYQTAINAHNHRSHRRDGYRLPNSVKLITEYFREADYYTANVTNIAPGIKCSGKADLNFTAENPSDGTDWNQRRPNQPFFAQVNFSELHRPFIKAKENPIDPNKVDIPPYYPDHPITREDWARYLDTIGYLDEKVGAVLKRLDGEDLAANTIVFFFADNGRAHVRGKQWLYEGGIHIPLIVRWPGKIKTGTVIDDLVSTIDITATSLKLAGITPPETMQGQVFLGSDAKERDYIIAARDRCDETVDRIRCVRTKRFKYIKNFYPEYPYSQLNRYKECEYPVLRLMRRLNAKGKLTPEQALFMAPQKPFEELYDLKTDPYEIHNLVLLPEYKNMLKELRLKLDHWIKETGDKGNHPEDPSTVAQCSQEMKELYDERIKKYYMQE